MMLDGVKRIDGGTAVLKYHAHLVGAELPELRPPIRDRFTLKFDGTRDPRVAGKEPHNGARCHGLSAARFPDETQYLALMQLEGQISQYVFALLVPLQGDSHRSKPE